MDVGGTVRIRLPGRRDFPEFSLRDGRMHLFVPPAEERATAGPAVARRPANAPAHDPRVRERLVQYSLPFKDESGRGWALHGYKRLASASAADAWRQTSILHVTLSGEDPSREGALVPRGGGAVHVGLASFLYDQLPSIRATGTEDPARQAWAVAEFSAFFFGTLRPIYLPAGQAAAGRSGVRRRWGRRAVMRARLAVAKGRGRVAPVDGALARGRTREHAARGPAATPRPERSANGRPERSQRSVVLVPGANSSCNTFVLPAGGLAAHLARLGCDVWLFDWRASPLVLNRLLRAAPLGGSADAERRAFALDRAVAEDLPAALKFVRDRIGDRPLSLLGHCVGGGGVAMAIARGVLAPFGVDRVVLSTLGLFYEVPWTTWIKAEDFLLERMFLPDDVPDCRGIDPGDMTDWPKVVPARPTIAGRATGSRSGACAQRMRFSGGCPSWWVSPTPVTGWIRRSKALRWRGSSVPSMRASIPILARWCGARYSAPFDTRDQIDRDRLYRGLPARRAPRGDLNPEPFRAHRITLVAAGDDGVWHRDSIDLMHEWLLRTPRARCEKHVVPGYNIQELFWAKDAPRVTYGLFSEGLGC